MDNSQKPTPPRQCPVCRIAMQATVVNSGVHHRCEQCGLTISVAPQKPKEHK